MSVTVYDILTTGVDSTSAGSPPTPEIPGISGQTIWLRGVELVITGATTLSFVDGVTPISKLTFVFPGAGTISLDDVALKDAYYHSVTPGNGISIVSSANVTVSGFLRYSQG